MQPGNPHRIAVTFRLQGAKLVAEIAPHDLRFYHANCTLADWNSRQVIFDTVDEIQRAVDLLMLDHYPPLRVEPYRLYQAGPLCVSSSGRIVSIPWRDFLSMQARLRRMGYPCDKEEAVIYLESVLAPRSEQSQRFRLVVNYALEDVRIMDRASGRMYDPRTLFQSFSRRPLPNHALPREMDELVNDLGGRERTIGVLFLRLRRANHRATIGDAVRMVSRVLG
jgi:hypothetical protein